MNRVKTNCLEIGTIVKNDTSGYYGVITADFRDVAIGYYLVKYNGGAGEFEVLSDIADFTVLKFNAPVQFTCTHCNSILTYNNTEKILECPKCDLVTGMTKPDCSSTCGSDCDFPELPSECKEKGKCTCDIHTIMNTGCKCGGV